MKFLLAFFSILFVGISSQVMNAQALHSLNIDNPKSFDNIKFGVTNFTKPVLPNSQVYLPDTLILLTASDSIRMSASYDQTGGLTHQLTQVRYNGYWVNYMLETWTYLNANYDNLVLTQYWSGGQWVNSELDSSTFDANGNMLIHLERYWHQGVWKDSILSSRTYDANGNMLTNTGKYMANGNWVNFDRSTYTYDGNGDQLTYLLEIWISNAWENSTLKTSSYDGNGDLITSTNQYWQDNQWKNINYAQYTYYAPGKPLTILLQTWSGSWQNSSLTDYIYDSNGYIINWLEKTWQSSSWVNIYQELYTNDLNGNIIHKLTQIWASGMWHDNHQADYTYDANNNELTGKNEQWLNSNWQPVDDQFILKFNGESYYFNGYQIDVSYVSINITDVFENKKINVNSYSLTQNYPNPFNPSTTISFTIPNSENVTLKVFDVLGREIVTLINEFMNTGKFDIQFNAVNLPSGIYIYRIRAGSYTESKKMILIK